MKYFYIFDLIKNLLKPHKLTVLLYLLMNLAFVYCGVVFILQAIILAAYDGKTPPFDVTSREYYLIVAGAVVVLHALCLFILTSPIGEFVLRIKNHCQSAEGIAEYSEIQRIFDEVYAAAREKNPSISPKVKLFINDKDKTPNAFAIGRRTVCVTRGLLLYSEEEIKGVLGHEFGHLANKDTDQSLLLLISSWMLNMIFGILWIALFAVKFVFRIISLIVGMVFDSLSALIVHFSEMMVWILSVLLIKIFLFIWSVIGHLLISAGSRAEEYRADRFSYELGYGAGLFRFLDSLSGSRMSKKNKLLRFLSVVSNVGSSHPKTWKRIEALEKLEAEKTCKNQ